MSRTNGRWSVTARSASAVNARRLARPVRSSVSESVRETDSVAVSRSSSAIRSMTVSSASTARATATGLRRTALAVDEHADRDRREGRREQQALPRRGHDRRAAHGQPRGGGQDEHREGPHRVVGPAREPAAVGAVDRIGRVDPDEHDQTGDERQPREARLPARAGEHRGQEGQQRDVRQRVGGARDRGAAGGVEVRERGLQRRGGGDRTQREAAEQSVEPHPHASGREASGTEQDDPRVEAEVRGEPQRVAPRGHGREAVVADVVDEPAAAVQQDAHAEAQPCGAFGLHPDGSGPGTGCPRRRRPPRRSAATADRGLRGPASSERR